MFVLSRFFAYYFIVLLKSAQIIQLPVNKTDKQVG